MSNKITNSPQVGGQEPNVANNDELLVQKGKGEPKAEKVLSTPGDLNNNDILKKTVEVTQGTDQPRKDVADNNPKKAVEKPAPAEDNTQKPAEKKADRKELTTPRDGENPLVFNTNEETTIVRKRKRSEEDAEDTSKDYTKETENTDPYRENTNYAQKAGACCLKSMTITFASLLAFGAFVYLNSAESI